jgi:hypothetical protein
MVHGPSWATQSMQRCSGGSSTPPRELLMRCTHWLSSTQTGSQNWLRPPWRQPLAGEPRPRLRLRPRLSQRLGLWLRLRLRLLLGLRLGLGLRLRPRPRLRNWSVLRAGLAKSGVLRPAAALAACTLACTSPTRLPLLPLLHSLNPRSLRARGLCFEAATAVSVAAPAGRGCAVPPRAAARTASSLASASAAA